MSKVESGLSRIAQMTTARVLAILYSEYTYHLTWMNCTITSDSLTWLQENTVSGQANSWNNCDVLRLLSYCHYQRNFWFVWKHPLYVGFMYTVHDHSLNTYRNDVYALSLLSSVTIQCSFIELHWHIFRDGIAELIFKLCVRWVDHRKLQDTTETLHTSVRGQWLNNHCT